MQKIKCIIVEDEPLAARVLRDYIQVVPGLELTAVFKEALSARDYLQQEKADLMFLDIHLPKLKGLDFLRTLLHPPVAIVTTAHHQYALEGFELSVADYLMKPVSLKRFKAAVAKAVKLIQAADNTGLAASGAASAIYLNVNRKKVKILLQDILYIESKREYVQISTLTKGYTSKISTNELEAMLPAAGFRRIHRSFIIAVAWIDAYTKEFVEIKGRQIPIGKNFRKAFSG